MKRWIVPSLLALAVLGAGAAIGTMSSAPLLAVHNPSPSMPMGWYLRVPLEPAVGRIVVIDPPAAAQAVGWPADVRLIKPVAAVGGDRVCAEGVSLKINLTFVSGINVRVGDRLIPVWPDCRILEDDELFLLAPARDDSVDSRIYGPVRRHDVLGVFTPIWTETP